MWNAALTLRLRRVVLQRGIPMSIFFQIVYNVGRKGFKFILKVLVAFQIKADRTTCQSKLLVKNVHPKTQMFNGECSVRHLQTFSLWKTAILKYNEFHRSFISTSNIPCFSKWRIHSMDGVVRVFKDLRSVGCKNAHATLHQSPTCFWRKRLQWLEIPC